MPQTPYSLPAGGTLNHLVISANTVIKTTPGQVCTVSVITSGSTSGSIHDCTTSGTATSGSNWRTSPRSAGLSSRNTMASRPSDNSSAMA